jgi:hypothetical protein
VGDVALTKPWGRLVEEELISEAKKFAIDVLGGISVPKPTEQPRGLKSAAPCVPF